MDILDFEKTKQIQIITNKIKNYFYETDELKNIKLYFWK